INSKYGTIEYSPVVFLQQDISFTSYLALLTVADACLITSLRDGMNLTSHEYVVCQETKKSPLIISEFAGTYGNFGAALRVNPWDTREVADAIFEALTMSEDDKVMRWTELYDYVSTHTAQSFVETFVKEVPKAHEEAQLMEVSHIPMISPVMVMNEYQSSARRLFFLDQDGTISPTPPGALDRAHQRPSEALIQLITSLASDPRNLVYIMSGRKREELGDFIGIPNVGLCAENGIFLMYANRNKWETMLTDHDLSWRKQVLEIFEYYTDRTPGSYIEQKEIGIVWHYELADVSFGSWQAAECQNHLQNAMGSTYPINSLAKKKSVEVMPRNVNKGTICRRVLEFHQGKISRRVSHSHFMESPASGNGGNGHHLQHHHLTHVHSASAGQHHHLNTHGHLGTRGSPYHQAIHNHASNHHESSAVALVSPGGGGGNVNASPVVGNVGGNGSPGRDLFDFILCVGDDRADEYMFEYLHRLDAGAGIIGGTGRRDSTNSASGGGIGAGSTGLDALSPLQSPLSEEPVDISLGPTIVSGGSSGGVGTWGASAAAPAVGSGGAGESLLSRRLVAEASSLGGVAGAAADGNELAKLGETAIVNPLPLVGDLDSQRKPSPVVTGAGVGVTGSGLVSTPPRPIVSKSEQFWYPYHPVMSPILSPLRRPGSLVGVNVISPNTGNTQVLVDPAGSSLSPDAPIAGGAGSGGTIAFAGQQPLAGGDGGVVGGAGSASPVVGSTVTGTPADLRMSVGGNGAHRRVIITATVERKSSNARWYIPGVNEVVALLESLAELSATVSVGLGVNVSLLGGGSGGAGGGEEELSGYTVGV
ncbi:threalose-6-phosphate phosphatase, partial [Blyttiomyces sp. JEL0837]